MKLTCELCTKKISPMSAFCKRTASAYRHMSCHSDEVYSAGLRAGRQEVLDEQEAGRRETQEREQSERAEREAREKAERERRAEVAERERTNQILARQAIPMPPKVQAPAPPAKQEEQSKKDRFDLIEVD